MTTQYLKINPADNVAVAIAELPEGETIQVDGKTITVKQTVPAGHKVALTSFAVNDHVVKYGYSIGHAIVEIEAGEWVNEKKIKTNLEGVLEYEYRPKLAQLNIPDRNLTFKGFKRKNGDVGIRNEIWIIPTVGCVNGIINQLAEDLRSETGGEGVDAIVAFPHNYGCSQLGDDHENTRKILRDMVLHPNAGGVLVVGLGCENNQPAAFREFLGDYDTERVLFMETGRGTPFGSFVPTMKISTNSTLAANKPLWIDFNAGVLLEGVSMDELKERFIEYILKVANGEKVNTEKKNFREISIFKTGVTL